MCTWHSCCALYKCARLAMAGLCQHCYYRLNACACTQACHICCLLSTRWEFSKKPHCMACVGGSASCKLQAAGTRFISRRRPSTRCASLIPRPVSAWASPAQRCCGAAAAAWLWASWLWTARGWAGVSVATTATGPGGAWRDRAVVVIRLRFALVT